MYPPPSDFAAADWYYACYDVLKIIKVLLLIFYLSMLGMIYMTRG